MLIRTLYGYIFQELERNIELCSKKLLRAEKLLSGLGGERTRWTQVRKYLNTHFNNSFIVLYRSDFYRKYNFISLYSNLLTSDGTPGSFMSILISVHNITTSKTIFPKCIYQSHFQFAVCYTTETDHWFIHFFGVDLI